MPQQLSHHFDILSNDLQQSRIRMPECVPSNALSQFDFPHSGTDVVSHDRLGPPRVPTLGMRTGKDSVFSLTIRRLSAPRKQRVGQSAVKRHRLLQGLGLARPDNLVDDRASYAYVLCGEEGHQQQRAFFDGKDG